MWEDLARALALVLVIEGAMPFLVPARWRDMMLRAASLEDRQLRVVGLVCMIAGLILLQVARWTA